MTRAQLLVGIDKIYNAYAKDDNVKRFPREEVERLRKKYWYFNFGKVKYIFVTLLGTGKEKIK